MRLAFEVHHADHASCTISGHGHFGADVGVGGDVARVLRCVVHAHHLARFGGGAGDALAQRHVVDIHALVVADAEEVAQGACRSLSTEQDAEGIVSDELAHGAGDLGEQFVQVEDGGELAGDVGQRLERAVLALHAAVQPGVVDGDADAAGDEPQQGAVVLGVSVDAGGSAGR